MTHIQESSLSFQDLYDQLSSELELLEVGRDDSTHPQELTWPGLLGGPQPDLNRFDETTAEARYVLEQALNFYEDGDEETAKRLLGVVHHQLDISDYYWNSYTNYFAGKERYTKQIHAPRATLEYLENQAIHKVYEGIRQSRAGSFSDRVTAGVSGNHFLRVGFHQEDSYYFADNACFSWKEQEEIVYDVAYQKLIEEHMPVLDFIEHVTNVMADSTIALYARDNAQLGDVFQGLGGNCVARTLYVLSILESMRVELPEYHRFGVQVYGRHIAPVIYNTRTNQVWDLVSGKGRETIDDYDPDVELTAPVYHTAYLYDILLAYLDSDHVLSLDELFLAGPSSSSSQAYLRDDQNPLITNSDFDFVGGAGVYNDGEIPEYCTDLQHRGATTYVQPEETFVMPSYEPKEPSEDQETIASPQQISRPVIETSVSQRTQTDRILLHELNEENVSTFDWAKHMTCDLDDLNDNFSLCQRSPETSVDWESLLDEMFALINFEADEAIDLAFMKTWAYKLGHEDKYDDYTDMRDELQDKWNSFTNGSDCMLDLFIQEHGVKHILTIERERDFGDPESFYEFMIDYHQGQAVTSRSIELGLFAMCEEQLTDEFYQGSERVREFYQNMSFDNALIEWRGIQRRGH